jgi:hypothetical protein
LWYYCTSSLIPSDSLLVSTPPNRPIGVSIAPTTSTINVKFRVAAKVFRLGILSYGKRLTTPELRRWLRVA